MIVIMIMFVNVLAKASNFFLLSFPFGWNYAGILLSSLYKNSIPRFNQVSNFAEKEQNHNDDQCASARSLLFLLLEPALHCKSVSMIINIVTFSPTISVLGKATETIWPR